jgi:transaldolase
MKKIQDLRIKIFADGAKIDDFKALGSLPYIKGFTTNPTLMKKAGITDYEGFIKEVLPIIGDKPVSFETIGDDFEEMKRQAVKLSKFGPNVYVKIPVMNTKGESSVPLVGELIKSGVKVNVTAVMTMEQINDLTKVLISGVPAVVSVFAGRIADTGVDPIPVMKEIKGILKGFKDVELLWASPRELLNIYHAEEAGCEIITVIPDILKKLDFVGYDLHNFSLDTVKMFFNDAVSSGLSL